MQFLMHTQQWKKARERMTVVTSHVRFTLQPEQRQERWRLYGHYLNYLCQPPSETDQHRHFRSFVRSIPAFSRDKAGYNIAVIILQLLYLLDHGSWLRVLNMAESLKRYRSRHLIKHSPQTAKFILDLCKLIESSSLPQHPAPSNSPVDALEGFQILPYNQVLKMVSDKIIGRLDAVKRSAISA